METLVLTPGVLSFCSHQRGRHAEHRRNLAPGNTVSRGQGPQAGLADLELRSFARGSLGGVSVRQIIEEARQD